MDIAIFVTLIAFSAFFSGSETAFFSLGKIRFKQIENMQTPLSKRVVSLLSEPQKLITTILIGNTIVNTAASSIMAGTLYHYFGEKGIGLSIPLMTVILLIFGEVTPKMLAFSNAVRFAFIASIPIGFIKIVLWVPRVILNSVAGAIVMALGIHISKEQPEITEQELRHLFSVSKKKGIVKELEEGMLKNILELKKLNAADVMTPRIDVIALDLTDDPEALIGKIKESKCSRLPVYMHSLDNIIGILYTKDFLLNPATPIKSLIKKAFFVPESMHIDNLLHELQERKVHMAVVTDEYGVTSGIVTIEDILEEIVGEIRDEFDFESPRIKMIDQKTFEADGQVHINDIKEELGINIETDEVDTIGGYITLILGEIPHAGDTVNINGYRVTVCNVSKNRITKILIEKTDLEE